MGNQLAAIQRQSGVAVWRQIADRLRTQIADRSNFADDRLPSETELAERFNVNRHTIRAAISALAAEGIVTPQRGRGTFIKRRERYVYPIRDRTRFSTGLDSQAKQTKSRIVSTSGEAASETVARALSIEPSSPVVRVDMVGEADGKAITCSTHWFDVGRFPKIAGLIRKTGSITTALEKSGIADYTRKETRIDAVHAGPADLGMLGLAPGAIVIVTTSINVSSNGTPIQYSMTRFAADRVSLEVS